MDIRPNEVSAKPETAQPLPWHKPVIQQLVVSLDTQQPIPKGGSFEDGLLHDAMFALGG